MIPGVIGFPADTAEKILESAGFCVKRVEYASKRGILHADSARVIRQRSIGNNSIEITVSAFKTKMLDN